MISFRTFLVAAKTFKSLSPFFSETAFLKSSIFLENLFKIFDMLEEEAKSLIEKKISLPAYDQCLKSSHVFNILDARGVISVAQRAEYIARIRDLTREIGKIWVETQN